MRAFLKYFILLLTCALTASLQAQNTSNEGMEFYAVFPSHVNAPDANNPNLAKYSIFITGKAASSGIVTVGTFSQRFNLARPNTVIEIDIPRTEAYINDTELNRTLSNHAIHIKVDDGKPKVVVYGHIFAGRRSAASLILPVNSYGQQYFTFNYPPARLSGQDYIVIVAKQAGTRVFLRKNGNNILPAGISLPNAGDIYEYTSAEDLTGTEVIVDKSTSPCNQIAVFSGSSTSSVTVAGCNIPSNSLDYSSDPLYQQNYPIESWGRTYGFIPFSTQTPEGLVARTRGNYFRVLAKDNATEVKLDGKVIATLNSGQFYQLPLPSTTAGLITANKPVSVAQYALSESCAGGSYSDPDMVILNPVEYNIRDITVYSSTKENISQQFINVLIKTSAASSFKINGTVPTKGFTALPSAPEYSYLTLSLNGYNTNNFVLTAGSGFNAIAYGFGYVESYAYSAGTNIASDQSVVAVRKGRTEELYNACTYEDFEFKLVLHEKASKLTWNFADDEQVIQNNPTAIVKVSGDTTTYEYYYPKVKIFETAGQYLVKILAEYSTANRCYAGTQEIETIFDVFNPSNPLFKSENNICPGATVSFEDQSVADGEPITTWKWNFGDGTTSTKQNPKHTYTQSGDYTVTLAAFGDSKCEGNGYKKVIHVREIPEAGFSYSGATCESKTITFKDSSDAREGNITIWRWDFGDGDTLSTISNDPLTHTFKKVGNYQVKLIIENSYGCISEPFISSVSVFAPSLKIAPVQYVLRGGKRILAPVVDGNNVKYNWSPSVYLDRDDIKNPTVTPKNDTTYHITITTGEGCVLTDSVRVIVIEKFDIYNTFTPNGDGVNDVWTIKYLDSYPEAAVSVFNRYGEKVFYSVGYSTPWDGRSKGENLPVGTYYYVIDTKQSFLPVYSGSVTILK